MKATDRTFTDSGSDILEFLFSYDVVSPRCSKKAHVTVIDKSEPPLFAPRRLTCTACGLSSEWRKSSVQTGFSENAKDWYFNCPFWYRTSCAGHELWVANREHLEFLKSYVSATLRSHVKSTTGWNNRSLANRLPKWISAASNRQKVLKALEQLEQQINQA
jgi:hypothetical protein